jgi:hypothetical protein
MEMSPTQFIPHSSQVIRAVITYTLIVSTFIFVGNTHADNVSLAWEESLPTGAEIQGYRIYYGTDGQSFPSQGCEVAGTSCTVSNLTPGQTYYFVATAFNMDGESDYSDPPISYTVPAAVANHTIIASTGPNGIISPSGAIPVSEGGSQSFTIAPAGGYRISDVTVDGESVGSASVYTFNNVFSDYTITAYFTPNAESTPTPNLVPERPMPLLPNNGEIAVSLTPMLEIYGFSDPDIGDVHGATRWQISTEEDFNHLLIDIVCDENSTNNYLLSLQVPHGTLKSLQTYYWRAMVRDARIGDYKWSQWSPVRRFDTAAEVNEDINTNGVPDHFETMTSDLDGNGLNDNEQPLMRVMNMKTGQGMLGLKAVDGVNSITHFTQIDPASIFDSPRPVLPYGLVSLNVNLEQIGGTARFELYLPEPPDEDAPWYKYDPINGWYEYPVQVISGKYILEIVDGGWGDADGAVNGIIVDPIGVSDGSTLTEIPTSDTASNNTLDELLNACFIETAAHRPTAPIADSEIHVRNYAVRFMLFGLLILGSAAFLILRADRDAASRRR